MAEAVEMVEASATDVVRYEPPQVQPTTAVALVPPVKAAELVERLSVIREAMTTAMIDSVDYGHIPGTDKPALLKPGAEKLGVLFQLDIQIVNEKRFGPGDHLTVMSRATVFHAPSGQRLGFGEGLCTTRERKYAYRKQERKCPSCGAAAVIKGKAEYGGGWLCWKKRDGCGAKFRDGDESIEAQQVGDVDNPDLPDLWNTILKMSAKRARVDAVLAVTGASALFTQDVEPDTDTQEPPVAQPPVEPAGNGNGQVRDYPAATPAVTADPPEQTQRIASAAQKRLVLAKARERELPPVDFLNALRVAAGLQVVSEPISDEHAAIGAKRIVDRLPARYVDAVLAQITDYVAF